MMMASDDVGAHVDTLKSKHTLYLPSVPKQYVSLQNLKKAILILDENELPPSLQFL